jgi:hypothetical protein
MVREGQGTGPVLTVVLQLGPDFPHLFSYKARGSQVSREAPAPLTPPTSLQLCPALLLMGNLESAGLGPPRSPYKAQLQTQVVHKEKGTKGIFN